MSYWSGFEVRMLGKFEASFEGKPLNLGMKLSAKPIQLLLLLLSSRESGVSRRNVIDALFGQESESDATNSLNVAVSRLRKALKSSGLPNEPYIKTQADRYYFECSFPVWIDIEDVSHFRQAADLATGSNKVSLIYQLCDLYYGRFLPDLDGEDWVEIERAHYQRIFRTSVEEQLEDLFESGSYGEALRLASFASSVFPFDGWGLWEARALSERARATNRGPKVLLCKVHVAEYPDTGEVADGAEGSDAAATESLAEEGSCEVQSEAHAIEVMQRVLAFAFGEEAHCCKYDGKSILALVPGEPSDAELALENAFSAVAPSGLCMSCERVFP